MKTWIIALAITTALLCPAPGLAHEGHTHKALGTITSVQADRVEIKTTEGKIVTLIVDKKTIVTRGKDKLDATALKSGERVSVEYVEVKKVLTAHSFKLGTTQAARK